MDNKAQVEAQFNWIYIAIVGGIIFLMFIALSVNIKNSAKISLEVDSLTYLDEIFVNLQGNEKTESSVSSPVDIEFSDEYDNCFDYSVEGAELGRKSTEFTPIFSPDIVKNRFLTYSLGWDLPFRTSYFLYITGSEVAYVFLGNLDLQFPGHITTKKVDNAIEFKDENYYKIRFITTENADVVLHNSVRKKDATLVKIIPYNDDIFGPGEIIYYNYMNGFEETGKSYYMDKPTLLAAVLSENHEGYECNLKKAMDRLERVTSILKNRVVMIKNADPPDRCLDSFYDRAITLLDQFETGEVSRSMMNNLDESKKQLMELNNELTRESCPTIY